MTGTVHTLLRTLTGLMLVLILTTCSGTRQQPVAETAVQNVVLILTDDQGAHLSALGTPGLRTPNIDALAENAVLFTNAFAAVPSCSPSRSSINTGMFPHANGHWRNTITPTLRDPDEAFGRNATVVDKVGIHEYIKTLPEVLHEAGYFTAITQKFHMSPPWKFPYSARNPVHNDPAKYREVIGEFIDAAGDKPFFFQANISPPHRPFFQHLEQFPEYRVNPDSVVVPGDLADTPAMRADWAEYLGCVQLADACTGSIIEVLRERGLLENTLIIFTGDQGQAYHRAKASAYYAGLHVPLIVSGPPAPDTGSCNDALISLTDLMPSILEFLKLPVPETVQGRSFIPLLGHSPNAVYRKYVFGEHNSHGPTRAEHYPTRMVFDGRWYYLRNLLPGKIYELPADLKAIKGWGNHSYEATIAAGQSHPEAYQLLRTLEAGRPTEELYDMDNDPFQTNNLAENTDYAKKKNELADVLDAWRKRTGDLADDPLDIPTRQQTKRSTH
ncbi:sulfatase [Neolewinella aurantiaca]|uniref:Sulfatase n=1 Tax=Neolewinella aurantiaca TaxID=2602767 RepID=A0A5C7FA99_9BACT|nr:sulfatase [Neolewinella aurantiaca]TXF86328.1 sulfatase [Neolewinella aurantiaca]